MYKCGIELISLSLTQPGIQGIADRTIAVDTAKKMNDDLAQIVAANPKRYAGFAAVALQDVRAAGDELERAVKQFGFKGGVDQRLREHRRREYRPIYRRAAGMGFLGSRGSTCRAGIPAPVQPF